MALVLRARLNQPQHESLSDTESNPRWGWLGLARETSAIAVLKRTQNLSCLVGSGLQD